MDEHADMLSNESANATMHSDFMASLNDDNTNAASCK